jgi:hypothetical protein
MEAGRWSANARWCRRGRRPRSTARAASHESMPAAQSWRSVVTLIPGRWQKVCCSIRRGFLPNRELCPIHRAKLSDTLRLSAMVRGPLPRRHSHPALSGLPRLGGATGALPRVDSAGAPPQAGHRRKPELSWAIPQPPGRFLVPGVRSSGHSQGVGPTSGCAGHAPGEPSTPESLSAPGDAVPARWYSRPGPGYTSRPPL